jgi:hypothetical protein
MESFGVRFSVNDIRRFETLRSLFIEAKRDKDSEQARDPSEWASLVPDEIKSCFSWPTSEERERWLAIRNSTPILISSSSEQLGSRWNFFRVFESIEEGEYDLLECEIVGEGVAEMHIDPHAYPYGGVGPLIALARGIRVHGAWGQ